MERLKSPRSRLFIALEPPDDLLERLVAWQSEALGGREELRLLPRQSLHVTLVFLGYQADRDVEHISATTFEEPGERFELLPEKVVRVPPRRPRLYAVEMGAGAQALVAWQGRLSERLERAGFYKPENRPFWPHLTVARLKRKAGRPPSGDQVPGRTASAGQTPVLPDDLRKPFQARAITLYKSTLRPQGALYEPLASVDL